MKAEQSQTRTRPSNRLTYWWRRGFWLLLFLPLLPEAAIYAVTGLGKIKGCNVSDTVECAIGEVPLSRIIGSILQVGVWEAKWMGEYGVAAVWLALCYVAITFGWRRRVGRVLLVIGVTAFFAVAPYLGPLLSISHLVNPKCEPNQGGVLMHLDDNTKGSNEEEKKSLQGKSCEMYGGEVGSVAHQTVDPALALTGFLVAILAFFAYGLFAIVRRFLRSFGWVRSSHSS